MMETKRFTTTWAGRELTVELGRFAQQASGSCTVQYGETTVLATACMSDSVRDEIDYFPLMVEFEERLYAAGKIKGSRFIKREGRPSDEAVLSGRLIDRSIRPLFDKLMRNDIQVVITVLSLDGDNDPNVPAMIAASLALTTSEIPWNGPIAGVRIGRMNNEWIINPSYKQREEGALDLFVAGTDQKVTMIEAGAREIPEATMIEAIDLARAQLKPIIELIEQVQQAIGVVKRDPTAKLSPEKRADREARLAVLQKSQEFMHRIADQYMFSGGPKSYKHERKAAFSAMAAELEKYLIAEGTEPKLLSFALAQVKYIVDAEATRAILEKGVRIDGRSLTDVRPLKIEVGVLPHTHGTGHFMRGETQVLSVVTLGSPGDEQTLDTMEFDAKKRYMHHYNFPPFSVGEVKPMRGPGRREIGHGALAERALEYLIPPKEEFPYTIRVVSEVLGSNGSSSMASTCGSTLALMDAGVPIKKHVAGVAMGLASDEHGNWKVLTDLQDLEDGEGGMDFKITGTVDGITAIQMDTKTDGLTPEIIAQTFAQARDGRMNIITQMAAVIPAARPDLSPHAPRIETIQIPVDKIREVIGPGGKVINEIIDKTGVQIDIEQDGRVMVTSNDAAGMTAALTMIKNIVREVEAGEIFLGKVVRIEDFGAFVNLLPNKDGLVHVSEIDWRRIDRPSDVLKIGDEVKVLVKEIDNLGRVNLSMKALKPKPEGYVEAPREDRGPRPQRPGGFGGGRPQRPRH